MKDPRAPSQGSSFSLPLLHPQGLVNCPEKDGNTRLFLSIEIDNKDNGGGGGRTGNEGKDAQLLLFQNRFWKLPEEKEYGKKRCGTAEVNINTMNWEESLGW